MSALSGPAAYSRSVDLLEQAFATHEVGVGDPWNAAPEIRSVLPDSERLLYIEAAKAYAALAGAAATMEVAGATVNGVVTAGWSEVLS